MQGHTSSNLTGLYKTQLDFQHAAVHSTAHTESIADYNYTVAQPLLLYNSVHVYIATASVRLMASCRPNKVKCTQYNTYTHTHTHTHTHNGLVRDIIIITIIIVKVNFCMTFSAGLAVSMLLIGSLKNLHFLYISILKYGQSVVQKSECSV